MGCKKVAILQPEVPHYRTEFFSRLKNRCEKMDVYVYNSMSCAQQNGFNVDAAGLTHIHNIQIKGFLVYSPWVLFCRKYDTLVLMWHFAHITTWLLLMTKFVHRKKIILWGQGISVKRYLREEKKPNKLLRWMLAMADGAWVYMEKETEQWKRMFPGKSVVALNNTLSGVDEMVEFKPDMTKDELRKEYGIKERVVLMFCARFTNPFRRIDLLVETIRRLDKERFGFVIIGDGDYKPDFSEFGNVYDFGAVYDKEVKKNLFALADLYFQPGWVGLSIVEAMAYGKPICTFRRNNDTLQCVEYSYIVDEVNGMIFSDMEDCIKRIENIDVARIEQMGTEARNLVKGSLSVCNMVDNAYSILGGK